MKSNKTRKLALVIAVTMLILAFSTAGFASYFTKTLQANYRNISVFVNGAQRYLTSEPFIVDGTTYVPLRDMATILGKTVTFNPANYRIDIVDTGANNSANVYQLQMDIMAKNAQIVDLQNKLDGKYGSGEVVSIRDLERSLQKEYNRIGEVYVESIDVELSRGDIETNIYVDLNKDRSKWRDLTTRTKERYLQKIVDEIRKQYKDAEIKGYIVDEYDDYEIVRFTLDKNGYVDIREYALR